MNKNRMLKWAKFLETVPPMHFDMHFYGLVPGGAMGTTPVCATSACALGWATAIPEFEKAGLELLAIPGRREALVYYRGLDTERAAMKFFGLTLPQAMAICLEDFNATATQKAAQIREMVAEAA